MAAKKWQRISHPQSLDDYGWNDRRLSERKRFLFMATIGKHIVPLMTAPGCIRVVEACEELAEGIIDRDTFHEIFEAGQRATDREVLARDREVPAIGGAANAFVYLLSDDYKHNECVYFALDALGYVAATEAGVLKPSATHQQAQAIWQHSAFIAGKEAAERTFLGCMHDIFGPNPYKPTMFQRAWRTDVVKAMAQSAYELRDFSALPVLADALEESGCDSTDILEHLRSIGPHVRGCWCLDVVLGK
jgi:hypothetical protein